ncbi:hypothetical protein GCM10010174_73090 [Kutzneria viridogrisea]|uniref:Uncharacterized protein n=2 Tax=Kutzneria TaxID=43356 RepID=W5W8U5_9PSEU|nr:hypothetical protein [Kutzneria albida]AHH97362.1 hypothetical protein KALB_3998 [Kutzneria albida DSM 43870]MBA8930720.1 hypothetical protein [Kutzneria viridogrisea]
MVAARSALAESDGADVMPVLPEVSWVGNPVGPALVPSTNSTVADNCVG